MGQRSVADKRETGYSGLFFWENTEGRGRGVTQHNRVPQSPDKARSAAQKQIAGFVFVTLANITSPLLYTFKLTHEEANRWLSKQMHKNMFQVLVNFVGLSVASN